MCGVGGWEVFFPPSTFSVAFKEGTASCHCSGQLPRNCCDNLCVCVYACVCVCVHMHACVCVHACVIASVYIHDPLWVHVCGRIRSAVPWPG